MGAIFNLLAEPINSFLQFTFKVTGNYFLAIIMLTVATRILLFPLNIKQMRYTKKMQELQPRLKELQQKHKDDREKLNQATMELWKQENINPVTGCLPIIVQLPILIALFQVLNNPANFPGKTQFLFWNVTTPDPFYILPILAGVTTYFQQKLLTTDRSQRSMLYIFPPMIAFFSLRFPAGLTLYWVVTNLTGTAEKFFLGGPKEAGNRPAAPGTGGGDERKGVRPKKHRKGRSDHRRGR
ncbi:MAG: membrane protein insertase YidC [Chloroflexi bacterium]|nr:membrane protein insertase YidC [Chloroflexota bacterium]